MKNILTLVSIFFLLLFLSACGNEANDKELETSSSLTTKKGSSINKTIESRPILSSSEEIESTEPVPTADETQASIDAENARLQAEWQAQLQRDSEENARLDAEYQQQEANRQAAVDAESARAETEAQQYQDAVNAENQRMAELDKANGY